ncbi:methyltransferase domain-containing protein [Halobacteria archaeon AArc-curdl1]|uniref:tRNA (guanine(10)-N(2))-dimethyltransferase n=1 Tax=Natronosalvus hydrolyticus TaxID=2979988 RepID=A0AAP2ZAG8_9EURY|nr:methyltransferase domain-containing protein [Halobacteria archaeon AArc-curdl1]
MYFLELGGEDDAFARCESRQAATGVRPLAPGLALANAISNDRLRGLAYTHRASSLLGHTDASLESARALLETASLERTGSVAVRATDVHGSSGISPTRTERELGSVLVERGFSVDLDDPDHVLRAAFSMGQLDDRDEQGDLFEAADDESSGGESVSVCALGWLAAESVRDFGSRAPTDKPFFQPGSMDPLLARAVVNIAGAGPGRTVLDPMCGTGGVLVEAGLVGADVLGTDAQAKMVAGARTNLAHFLDDSSPSPTGVSCGDWHVARGDGTRLPVADSSVDSVVFDAPYGRQSKIETHRLEDLVAGALAEARRVADRAVVVADRSWASAARDAGWELEAAFERRVHRSLTRYVLVLSAKS